MPGTGRGGMTVLDGTIGGGGGRAGGFGTFTLRSSSKIFSSSFLLISSNCFLSRGLAGGEEWHSPAGRGSLGSPVAAVSASSEEEVAEGPGRPMVQAA